MAINRRAILVLTALLAACSGRETVSTPSETASQGPASASLNGTTLAVYLPSSYREMRFLISNSWVAPGKALEDSVLAVTQHYFQKSFLVDAGDTRPYGLLLTMQPEWKFDSGKVEIVMAFKVFAADGAPLLEGHHDYSEPIGNYQNTDSFYNDALHATQFTVDELLSKLAPTSAKYPETQQFASIDPKRYVNNDKPRGTGTAFLINDKGQVMTAAHVVHDCARIELRRDGKSYDGKLNALSPLLDVAVLDSDIHSATPLVLRKGEEATLGEPVANVGFPLQPLLSPDPTLTRGNVSSRGGLAGSLGKFQFSAPIQPGSSGGPVVSDEGELLGVTQATLNASLLIQKGILPQNVNFALDSHYAAMFLRRNKIPFAEVDPKTGGSPDTGNKAALASVVSVACYQ